MDTPKDEDAELLPVTCFIVTGIHGAELESGITVEVADFCLSIYLGTKHFSVVDFLAYLFGHGTWLYYVPIYFCILLIYNLIHFLGGDYILMLISVLSNIVSYYCNLSGLDAWITFYQNPFNFMLFFSLGKILKENSIIEKIKGIYVFPLISLIIIIGYFFIKYNLCLIN